MQYKNFSLRIDGKLSDGYPVAVQTEGSGETFGTIAHVIVSKLPLPLPK